ncbi:MAG: cupin domain-containing protein [Chloroflexi bacterium]|nr:MAG: cupin domain-containing protein [Chloroflexota bacterium]
MDKVNVSEKFARFTDYWSPKIVGELNEFHVKLVKIEGEFVWHHHEDEDEMFFVIKGTLIMKLRDKDVVVNEGEFIVIPHGVEHKPVAETECHIMLFEPKETLNTGNVQDEKTVAALEWI